MMRPDDARATSLDMRRCQNSFPTPVNISKMLWGASVGEQIKMQKSAIYSTLQK
jgi:hypothetical protein